MKTITSNNRAQQNPANLTDQELALVMLFRQMDERARRQTYLLSQRSATTYPRLRLVAGGAA